MFTDPVEVEGFGELNVHYVHQMSSVQGAISLLFVHGFKSALCMANVESACEFEK